MEMPRITGPIRAMVNEEMDGAGEDAWGLKPLRELVNALVEKFSEQEDFDKDAFIRACGLD